MSPTNRMWLTKLTLQPSSYRLCALPLLAHSTSPGHAHCKPYFCRYVAVCGFWCIFGSFHLTGIGILALFGKRLRCFSIVILRYDNTVLFASILPRWFLVKDADQNALLRDLRYALVNGMSFNTL